jgi:hypothetical protein
LFALSSLFDFYVHLIQLFFPHTLLLPAFTNFFERVIVVKAHLSIKKAIINQCLCGLYILSLTHRYLSINVHTIQSLLSLRADEMLLHAINPHPSDDAIMYTKEHERKIFHIFLSLDFTENQQT